MGEPGVIALQGDLQLAVLGGGKAQLAFLVFVVAGAQNHIKEIAIGAFRRPADDTGPGGDKVLGLYGGTVAPAGILPQGEGINRAFGGVLGGGNLPAFGDSAHRHAVFIHGGQALVQHPQQGTGRKAAVIPGRVGFGHIARHADADDTGVGDRSRKILLFTAAGRHGDHQNKRQQQSYRFFHVSSSVSG